MRTILSLLALSCASLAVAASDFQEFDRRVSKYATVLGREPKRLCLCQDGSPLDGGTGFLLRGTSSPEHVAPNVIIVLLCLVPVFDDNSEEKRADAICARFVPLAK